MVNLSPGTPPSMHDMATRDPHVVTCVLKSFLRSLPEPLLTHDMYTKYIAEKNGTYKIISNAYFLR